MYIIINHNNYQKQLITIIDTVYVINKTKLTETAELYYSCEVYKYEHQVRINEIISHKCSSHNMFKTKHTGNKILVFK